MKLFSGALATSQLNIRLASGSIAGRLRRRGGGEAVARLPVPAGTATADVLGELLGRLVPRAKLAAPRVEVELAGEGVRCSVLSFDALPKASADRALVVTQRFCREHKLNAKDVAVAFSVHPARGAATSVLAAAVPRGEVEAIKATFAGYGLYCDVIAPELSVALAAVEGSGAAQPAVLAVASPRGCTLLLLGAGRQPLSVAYLAAHAAGDEPGTAALAHRLSTRVARYAGHFGVPVETLAIHVSDAEESGLGCALRTLGASVRLVGAEPQRRAAA